MHRSNENIFNLIRYRARKEQGKEILYMEMPGKLNEVRKRVKQTSREEHCTGPSAEGLRQEDAGHAGET